MENTNSEAMPAFDSMARFADLAEAQAYLALHGQGEAFAPIADQGEYILYRRISADRLAQLEAENGNAPQSAPPADPAPKARPQGKARGKRKAKGAQADAPQSAPPADPAPAKARQGKKGSGARIAAQGDLKGKARAPADPAPAKDYGNSWRPLSARKWIGPWADYKAKAEKGKGPDAGSAKLDIAKLEAGKPWNEAMLAPFNGAFSANTHWPFRKRIAALAAVIRAKDMKGLKALEIKEISTTPNMLAKLRDLAISALSFKAEKANGKKAKADRAPAQADTPLPGADG